MVMKLAVISDTHFGDELCSLVEKSKDSYIPGPKYQAFKDAVGTKNDYLILLGDILDFSVASYADAYRAGKAFFTMIQKDKIADQYLYVPGNHDFDIWTIVEHEVNIIYQLKQGKIPRKFRMSVPAVIDDRKNSPNPGLTLPGVDIRTNGKYSYGGLFLDNITTDHDSETNSIKGKESHFTFAYPNLYIVTDDGSFLLTHGQYLEHYWSLLSEWVPIIFGSDLPVGSAVDMAEFVGINFPFNQLACSGVGQAGVLTEVISKLQAEVRKGDLKNAKKYLDNLDDYLDDNVFNYKKWYQFFSEATTDLISNKVKEGITKAISSTVKARNNEQWLSDPEVGKQLLNYYNSSYVEINDLKWKYNMFIPAPETIIFGHTHEPVPWGDPKATKALPASGPVVRLFNCGGWVCTESGNNKKFCGAEVFKYETGKGFSSVSVR